MVCNSKLVVRGLVCRSLGWLFLELFPILLLIGSFHVCNQFGKFIFVWGVIYPFGYSWWFVVAAHALAAAFASNHWLSLLLLFCRPQDVGKPFFSCFPAKECFAFASNHWLSLLLFCRAQDVGCFSLFFCFPAKGCFLFFALSLDFLL